MGEGQELSRDLDPVGQNLQGEIDPAQQAGDLTQDKGNRIASL